MQKLTIFGATGGTGQQLVRQSLDVGHQVTALVRDATRLPIQHERLRVTIGTIEDGSAPLQHVSRLAFVSAIGVGDAYADAPLSSRIVIKVLLRDIYADKAIGEDLIRKSGLEWTIVQPARLTDRPLTGRYQAGEHLKQRGMPKISRADLAHFLLNQVDDRTYVRKTVRLGY